MKLRLLSENQQRLAWLDKTLTKAVPDANRRLAAAQALLDADPTNAKKLAQWLAKLVNNGVISIRGAVAAREGTQIRLPEDQERVQNVLVAYERAKPRLTQEQRDLNRFGDFYKLEDVVEKAINSGEAKASAGVARKVPGAEIVYNQPPWTLYYVEKIGKGYDHEPDEIQRIKAIQTLGMGPPETRWCTRAGYGDSYAAYYLSRGDMLVLYKDGMPFMQKCKNQVMDVYDRNMKMETLPDEIRNAIGGVGRAKREMAFNRAAAEVEELKQKGADFVVTANGVVVPYLKIADAGPYYYIAVARVRPGLASKKMSMKKREFLAANGLMDTRPAINAKPGDDRVVHVKKYRFITPNKGNVQIYSKGQLVEHLPPPAQPQKQPVNQAQQLPQQPQQPQHPQQPQQPQAPAQPQRNGILQRLNSLFRS